MSKIFYRSFVILFAAALCTAQTRAENPKPSAAPSDAKPTSASSDAKPAAVSPDAKPAANANDAKAAVKAAEPNIPELVSPAQKPKPVKELTSCAKSLAPLTDGYKQAYESLVKWTAEVDAKTVSADAKVVGLQEQIQQNEAAITKLKLEDDKIGASRIRELSRSNKQLWDDLKTARSDKAKLCQELSRATAQKVRQYASEIQDRLRQTQLQMK